MAQAILITFEGSPQCTDTTITLMARFLFSGSDVPGGALGDFFTVSFPNTSTGAQIDTAIRSAVTDFATSKGFTVGASAIIVPSFQRI